MKDYKHIFVEMKVDDEVNNQIYVSNDTSIG